MGTYTIDYKSIKINRYKLYLIIFNRLYESDNSFFFEFALSKIDMSIKQNGNKYDFKIKGKPFEQIMIDGTYLINLLLY